MSIISENVVDLVHPDWKYAKSANPVSLSGVTGKFLGVIDRKILNISFSPDERENFPHPFAIVKQPDLLILSSQAMYSKLLGIECSECQGTPFLSWRDRRGKKQLNELSPEPKSITGKLDQDIHIVGLGEKLASFVAEKPISLQEATVQHFPDHLANKSFACLVLINPSLDLDSDQINEYFGKRDYASYGQVISNLPPIINQALASSREKIEKLASQLSPSKLPPLELT